MGLFLHHKGLQWNNFLLIASMSRARPWHCFFAPLQGIAVEQGNDADADAKCHLSARLLGLNENVKGQQLLLVAFCSPQAPFLEEKGT